MRTVFAALALALTWPSAQLQAREPLRLPPATKWVLEYAEENCRLARKFGQGRDEITLILDQFEPADEFKVILVGEPVRSQQVGLANGTIQFGPREAKTEFKAQPGTVGTQRALILQAYQRLAPLTAAEEAASKRAHLQGGPFELPLIGSAREAAATWVALTKAFRRDLILETGSMGEPLAALRKCSWDTVGHWGLNVEQQKTLSRKVSPKTSPASWLKPEDYPRKLAFAGYPGIVTVRLIIDGSGIPTSCRVQRSTQMKEFEEVVCRQIMKNGRFHPALDARGQPVQSFYVQTVSFQLA